MVYAKNKWSLLIQVYLYMNTLFIIILAIILFDFVFDKVLDFLNLKNLSPDLPKEAAGIYDAEKYKKSQEYYKVNHNFSTLTSIISLVSMLAMLFLNGFAFVDSFARQYTQNPILMETMMKASVSIRSRSGICFVSCDFQRNSYLNVILLLRELNFWIENVAMEQKEL